MKKTAADHHKEKDDMIDALPVLGICGYSGSGKTTLIENVLPLLRARGLNVAVVKHDAHGIDVDRRAKDSDRFFEAGADVLLQGPWQEVLRAHRSDDSDLTHILQSLAGRYDLVLVEGHKSTPLSKVWLLDSRSGGPPPGTNETITVLPRGSDRVNKFMSILEEWLPDKWLKTPVFGCVLIGGKSRRMGRPKHLLRECGKTWLERTVDLLRHVSRSVVVVGDGAIPEGLTDCVRLPDVPDAEGPMAGLLAAMRWAPRSSWLVVACDLPDLTLDALRWLLSTRAPGVWATLPKMQSSFTVEPLLAHYDFRSHLLIEQLAARRRFKLRDIAPSAKVFSPAPPPSFASAWRNVNTSSDLISYRRLALPNPHTNSWALGSAG